MEAGFDVSVNVDLLCGPELTRQTDAPDGCLLHDAVHGQVCAEPGNAFQFARRPCMFVLECLEGSPCLPSQNLKDDEYAWTSAVFYFGYLVWSWPSSYLIVRLPIGKYLSVSV